MTLVHKQLPRSDSHLETPAGVAPCPNKALWQLGLTRTQAYTVESETGTNIT